MQKTRPRCQAISVEEPLPSFLHRPDRNVALTGIDPPIPRAEYEAAQAGKQHVSEGWGKLPAQRYVWSHKYCRRENMQGGR